MRTVKVTLASVLLVSTVLVPVFSSGTQEEETVKTIAVVTPYMANATTAFVIEEFKKSGAEQKWRINVSDTAGDFGLLVSRIEDAVAQNVDAIVLGMGDPSQMFKGLKSAKEVGIPVFGLDAGLADGVILNITSDNADLGRQTAEFLVESIGGEGKVIMYTHDPHPGVRTRAAGAQKVFDSYPGIEVLNKFHIDVPGPVDNARNITEDLLTSYSEKDSIDGIWAGWDEVAYGTMQALEENARTEVKVVGIDGTDFAKAEIDKGSCFIGTIEQDFGTMAIKLVDLMNRYFNGETLESDWYQIPGKMYKL